MTNWNCAYLRLAQPTCYIELKICGIWSEALWRRIEFARNDTDSYQGHALKSEVTSLYGITQKNSYKYKIFKGCIQLRFLIWTFLHRFGSTGINVFPSVMLKLWMPKESPLKYHFSSLRVSLRSSDPCGVPPFCGPLPLLHLSTCKLRDEERCNSWVFEFDFCYDVNISVLAFLSLWLLMLDSFAHQVDCLLCWG